VFDEKTFIRRDDHLQPQLASTAKQVRLKNHRSGKTLPEKSLGTNILPQHPARTRTFTASRANIPVPGGSVSEPLGACKYIRLPRKGVEPFLQSKPVLRYSEEPDVRSWSFLVLIFIVIFIFIELAGMKCDEDKDND
jgi:hypothetical protein